MGETKKFAGEFESESLTLFFGKTCLFTLFKRLQLLDEYKKRQAEALVLSFADDDIEDDRELIALVQKALSQLSEQQRRIVELHVMEGKKYLEIADLLQLSENTVRTHLKRAYKILRENLSCLFPNIFF